MLSAVIIATSLSGADSPSQAVTHSSLALATCRTVCTPLRLLQLLAYLAVYNYAQTAELAVYKRTQPGNPGTSDRPKSPSSNTVRACCEGDESTEVYFPGIGL